MTQQINLSEQAYLPSGTSLSLSGSINDSTNVISLDPTLRTLNDETGLLAVTWNQSVGRLLWDAQGSPVISVDWGDRQLYDESDLLALSWSTANGRYLADDAGNSVLDWSTTNTVSISSDFLVNGPSAAHFYQGIDSDKRLFLSKFGGSPGAVVFSDIGGSPNTVTIAAPTAVTSSYTVKLPVAQGGAGTVIQNDGSGNLSWATVTSSPAGANTQVQFNNAGVFGASASFTWNGTTLTATKFAGTEIDVNGTKAIDLTVGTGRALVTSGGTFVLDWQNTLLATSGGTSVNWGNRTLNNTAGGTTLSWATTGQLLAVDGSAAAPLYSFTNRPTAGMYNTGAPAGGVLGLKSSDAASGGRLQLSGGTGTAGAGGAVTILGGTGSTNGGGLTISGGTGSGGNGGDVAVSGGNASGTPGSVILNTIAGAGSWRFDAPTGVTTLPSGVAGAGAIKPTTDSATALQFTNAAGTISLLQIDTTNALSTFRLNNGGIEVRSNSNQGLVFNNAAGSSTYVNLVADTAGFLKITGVNDMMKVDLVNTTVVVGANALTEDASSIFTVNSTTKGLLPPRMTTSQKNLISSPGTGLTVYDTTLNLLQVYNGTSWVNAAPGQTYTAGTGLTLTGNQFSLTAPVTVALGGTGQTSLTNHAVLLGQGTSAVAFAGPGTTNFALVSTGAATDPTFQAIVNSLTGTANQVSVSASTGSITLSTPQNIATTSSPTFAAITLNGTAEITGGNALRLDGSTSGNIQIRAADTTTSYSIKLPSAQGAATTVMLNDGSGNLSWSLNGTGTITQNTYTVGTPLNTYTGSTTLFNLPFTYVQDGKSLQVMYNGQVLVSGVDYNETSNTSVTFTSALTAGFTAVFRSITPSTPSNTSVAQYANFVVGTASGSYTGSTTVYNLPFAYTQDGKSLEVFYDGVQLVPGDDYTETTSTSITTTQALTTSQKIAFRTISTIGTAAAVTALRENYVVGTANGNYTGSTTVFNLINTYTPGGVNLQVFLDGDLQTVGATVDYVETNPTTVTFNNALVAAQKVTFTFSQTTAPTGVVTSGTAGQIAYYASTGSTIAGTNDPAAISSVNSTFLGLGRNRFINGEMSIDQKYSGASTTADNATLAYLPDMFLLLANFGQALEGVFSIQRLSATPPTGFTNYARVTVTTADASISATNAYEYISSIEGNNIRDFLLGTANAKAFTLSFWVRSSLTGTFGGGFINQAQDRSYVFQYTINAANTWEKKTISLTGDTTGTWVMDNTRGLQIFWDMGSGSNFQGTANVWQASGGSGKWRAAGNTNLVSTNGATWDMTGVQLELGSTATSFEYLPIQTLVSYCQRYYEKSYPIDSAIGTAGLQDYAGPSQNAGASPANYCAPVQYKIEKRVIPTLTFYAQNGTLGSWNWVTSGGTSTLRVTSGAVITTKNFNPSQSVSSTEVLAEGHWVANAGLQ